MTAMSEAAIFHGYRHASDLAEPDTRSAARSETCACGGVIRVTVDSPQFVLPAVQAHQRTAIHRLWRMGREAES